MEMIQTAAIGPTTDVELLPFSETAVLVEFGKGIHPETYRKVRALAQYLERHPFPGMREYISAYSSVTVLYDPVRVKQEQERIRDDEPVYQFVASMLQEMIDHLDCSTRKQVRTVQIPVCYGGEFGPDLEYVANSHQLLPEEVIEIHSTGKYLVYMIGFAPGFPFLGGLDERIATPRRSSPRLKIPVGSVGIAGMQTGVYPLETPGGWQLIGRTPLALFRPAENPPSFLRAGDIIRFSPISPAEYTAYKEERTCR